MTEDQHIERYFKIVQGIYERLLAEGKWDEVYKQLDDAQSESSAS